MQKQILVAGGGIGGMAAALAAGHAGWKSVQILERASAFSEVGAGVQLGPNVVRCLQHWGLEDALKAYAAFPEQLQVRSARSARLLGCMPLGSVALARYGAPYATIHRADLHQLLWQAVQVQGVATLQSGVTITQVSESTEGSGTVGVQTDQGQMQEGAALIGADGLWSQVRAHWLGAEPPRFTGHLAYRALVPVEQVPAAWRMPQVVAWLGARLHVVHYPVRQGTLLNVVVIVEGDTPDRPRGWDFNAPEEGLQRALQGCSPVLKGLLEAVTVHAQVPWRLWPLYGRNPLRGPRDMAQGRVALLGDAAHPMLPYLAQGAGMAIEDALALQQVLANAESDVPSQLQRYAHLRWQRNARVQARSARNGRIFHASAPISWGRDMAMALLGSRLMDVPWLYRGAAT